MIGSLYPIRQLCTHEVEKIGNTKTIICNFGHYSTAWYLNYPWDSRLIKGRHNGGLIFFGSSYKHCQHDLADH